MPEGYYETNRKSVVSGVYVEVTESSGTDYVNIFHDMCTQIRPLLNDTESTFYYVLVKVTGQANSPYYGTILKVSSTIMTGFCYSPAIADTKIIKFRDSSSDAAATYQIYNLTS